MAVNIINGGLAFEATLTTDQFKREINALEQRLRGLVTAADKSGAEIENLSKRAAIAIGSYFSIQAASNFVQSLVQVRGEFQQVEVSLRTMLGNKEKANALFAQMVDLAAKTPFQLSEVAAAGKQLLAYGFAAENVTKNITMLGNVASGVSAPLGEIIYLYGTLQTQGRAYTRDIIQFTSRGIPVIAELAKQFKVSQSEVMNLVEAGKVGFPEIEKVFKSMTGKGGMFFNLMEEQSKTLTGQISNLKDAWSVMLNDIGKGQEGIFSDSIQAATSLINNYQKVLDVLKILVATYGAYRAALIATAVVQSIQIESVKGYTIAETLRYRAMLISEGMMKLLNRTMLSNPIIAVTTALVALTSAYLIFHKTVDKVKDAQDALSTIQKQVAEATDEERKKIELALASLNDYNASQGTKKDALMKLRELTHDSLQSYKDEEILAGKATNAIKDYVKTIEDKAARERVIIERNRALDNIRNTVSKRNSISTQTSGEVGLEGAISGARLQQAIKQVSAAKRVFDVYDNALKNLNKSIKQREQQNSTNDVNLLENPLLNFDTLLNTSKSKAQLESLKKALEDKMEALAPNDKQLSTYKSKIVQINALLKAYSIEKPKEDHKSDFDKFSENLENKKQAYQLYYKAIELYGKESADKQYAILLNSGKDYLDYLQSQKMNFMNGKQTSTSLAKIQLIDTAINDETGVKNNIESFKNGLEQQKTAFIKFEEWKLQFGAESAKKQFGADSIVGYYASYKQALQSLLASLPQDNKTNSIEKRKTIAEELTRVEQEETEKRFNEQKQFFTDLLNETKTFQQKKQAIQSEYNKKAFTLTEQFKGTELADRMAILKYETVQNLDQAQDEAFKRTDIYKQLNQDLLNLSIERLRILASSIQKELTDNKNLTDDIKSNLQNSLTEKLFKFYRLKNI